MTLLTVCMASMLDSETYSQRGNPSLPMPQGYALTDRALRIILCAQQKTDSRFADWEGGAVVSVLEVRVTSRVSRKCVLCCVDLKERYSSKWLAPALCAFS